MASMVGCSLAKTGMWLNERCRVSGFSEKVGYRSQSLGHGSDILLNPSKRFQCPAPFKGVQKGRALRTCIFTLDHWDFLEMYYSTDK
jgi:hypothetical protein